MPAATFSLIENKSRLTSATTVFADTLDPYQPTPGKPWNARRVAHLYRRIGFGATLEQINQGLALDPSALVDQLLNTAAALSAPPVPQPEDWSQWTSAQYANNVGKMEEHRRYLRHRWFSDMLDESVRAKMSLFWHNHFVTKLYIVGCNTYTWKYFVLLHQYAFGNFREFVLAMGKNPAMLVFLNGNVNEAGEPNENYARELMELFTMGEGNGYTQNDVVEMARALTGWKASFNDCTPHFFDPTKFDNNPKTIFGVTGNYDSDSAHNLIFQERPSQVSEFIAGKLYRHFVFEDVDPDILQGLAATFRDNNWELLPMIKQLLKSEHFFEERFINARIKSPMELLIPIMKTIGSNSTIHALPIWWDDTTFWMDRLGQVPLDPPNVAGWPGYRKWINESTLANRWKFAGLLMSNHIAKNDALRTNLRALAQNLTNNSNDPAVIVRALVDFFCGQELDAIHFAAAVEYFKNGIPEGYFTDGSWNLGWTEAPDQVIALVGYLAKQPEFQLM
ncbi:MAG: DUF1800 family protein [Saprospiraceae bacterium]